MAAEKKRNSILNKSLYHINLERIIEDSTTCHLKTHLLTMAESLSHDLQEQNAPKETTTRGKNFSSIEDFALARAWGSATQVVDEMNNDNFWGHVAAIFHKQPESSQQRTTGSLQARFLNIAKVTQKYLAAEKLYRSAIPSGETEEDTLENIMKLYRESNKVKVKGVTKLAPEIRFMSGVRLLSKLPKFSMEVGGTKRQMRKGCSGGESDDSRIFSGNVSSEAPSSQRPAGAKRQKLSESNGNRLATSVENVAAALRTSADVKKAASSIALQLKIFKSIDLPPDEKTFRLERLLRQANLMETSEDTGGLRAEPPAAAK